MRRQLAPLERQARAAERHGAVVDELRALRLYLVGHQLAGLQTRLARLRDERQELAERDRALHERLAALDDAVVGAEASLTVLGVEGLAEWVARVEALRERGRGLAALLTEKRRGLERELATAADTGVVETLVADAVTLRNDLAALDAAELTLPGTDALDAAATAEDTLHAAEERWRAAEGDAARARAGADALERQLRAVRADAAVFELDAVAGVVGPLVDHLEIEAGAEAAVASALGDAMRAVVVRGPDAVREAITRLRAAETTALLLVVGDDLGPPARDAPPGGRMLRDAVRARDDALHVALGRLLDRHVLVRDWRAALDLVTEHPEVVAVTLDGDRLGGDGPWHVGGGHGTGVTQRALEEAQAHATAAEVTRAEAERTVETARAALGAARAAELQPRHRRRAPRAARQPARRHRVAPRRPRPRGASGRRAPAPRSARPRRGARHRRPSPGRAPVRRRRAVGPTA